MFYCQCRNTSQISIFMDSGIKLNDPNPISSSLSRYPCNLQTVAEAGTGPQYLLSESEKRALPRSLAQAYESILVNPETERAFRDSPQRSQTSRQRMAKAPSGIGREVCGTEGPFQIHLSANSSNPHTPVNKVENILTFFKDLKRVARVQ